MPKSFEATIFYNDSQQNFLTLQGMVNKNKNKFPNHFIKKQQNLLKTKALYINDCAYKVKTKGMR
jgi:hypothetical protein